jgi:hypothetical protein
MGAGWVGNGWVGFVVCPSGGAQTQATFPEPLTTIYHKEIAAMHPALAEYEVQMRRDEMLARADRYRLMRMHTAAPSGVTQGLPGSRRPWQDTIRTWTVWVADLMSWPTRRRILGIRANPVKLSE